jgi:hypothetical protein
MPDQVRHDGQKLSAFQNYDTACQPHPAPVGPVKKKKAVGWYHTAFLMVA